MTIERVSPRRTLCWFSALFLLVQACAARQNAPPPAPAPDLVDSSTGPSTTNEPALAVLLDAAELAPDTASDASADTAPNDVLEASALSVIYDSSEHLETTSSRIGPAQITVGARLTADRGGGWQLLIETQITNSSEETITIPARGPMVSGSSTQLNVYMGSTTHFGELSSSETTTITRTQPQHFEWRHSLRGSLEVFAVPRLAFLRTSNGEVRDVELARVTAIVRNNRIVALATRAPQSANTNCR